jgi:hypothetical protein
VSSRTDEQTDRAQGSSRGRAVGVRAVCAAAAVSALVVAGSGPACAAVPGSRSLPRPVPQAARAVAAPVGAAAPVGVGARSLTADTDLGATTLVTTGGEGAVQSGAVSVIDVIMVAPTASRPGGTVDLRTFADCEGGGSGVVSSSALASPATLAMAADGGLFAEDTVARDAKPGAYPLVESCDGKTVATGRLTVRRLGAPAAGGGWGATRLADSGSGLGSGLGAALGLGGARTTGGAPSRTDEYASLALIAAASVGALLFGYQRRRAVRG